MSNLAVDALIKKRDDLKAEQIRIARQFDAEISEIETAIEKLDGKKVWEFGPDYHYDDENPNYIKGSLEEQ